MTAVGSPAAASSAGRRIAAAAAAAAIGLIASRALALDVPKAPIKREQLQPQPRVVPPLVFRPLPGNLPDLKVARAWIGRPLPGGGYGPLAGNPVAGQQVHLLCDFVNLGSSRMCPVEPCRWKIGFYIDDLLVGEQPFDRAPSGQTMTGALPFTIPRDGTHRYACKADFEGKITEQSEDNNRLEVLYLAGVGDSPGYGVVVGDEPTGYSLDGAFLRVTALTVDDADGHIVARLENAGAPMLADARVRLYQDNVQIKECAWPKGMKQTSCSTYAYDKWSPPQLQRCTASHDAKVHAQIIAGQGEHEAVTTGKYREAVLHARQDLSADHLTKDPIGRLSAVFSNKGLCDSTTWSYRVSVVGGQTLMTSGILGSLARGQITQGPINPQPPAGMVQIKVEVLPANPAMELSTANNVLTHFTSVVLTGFDLAPVDLKLRGEVNLWDDAQRSTPEYNEIIPVIRNVGDADMPGLHVKYLIFIDGVATSPQARDCLMGLDKGDEVMFDSWCMTGAHLPPGEHTVLFKITSGDANVGNNSLTKTFYRP